MIVIVLILNAIHHSFLILVRGFELILEELLVKLLLLYEYLLLVSDNEFSWRHPLRKSHLESLSLLFFFTESSIFLL